MAEGHSGRLRPSGALGRGLWTLLLAPVIVVAFPALAAADDVDPNYPVGTCVTKQTLRITPAVISSKAELPRTVTVTATGFPTEATVQPLPTPPPDFTISIFRDGTKVATARGEGFTTTVEIPKGAADNVVISAESDPYPECHASNIVSFELPPTGANPGPALWLGLITLALGSVLVVGARRRTHAPERHRMAFAGAGAAAGPALFPAPARPTDDVVSEFAPQPHSAPVPAAVLDRFAVDEQLSLLTAAAPSAPSGPPARPSVPSIGEAVEQLRSIFASLARDD
jgi:hypothetical protein